MPAERISFPSRTIVMMVRILAALDHAKPSGLTNALIASTVLSSTIALTCAMREPIRVRMRVTMTSQRYGYTYGLILLKSSIRFIVR